jgi:uncharacterized membrane protein YphA (DoxX/SURF4 family)
MRLALLAVCAAYLQGGIDKLIDFQGAIGEMQHFGLAPAVPMAIAVIVLEIGASVLIIIGLYRWLCALALGAFTLAATFLANPFWQVAGPDRIMMANSFFEHIGLCGAFVLIAWHDLQRRTDQRPA